MTHTENGGIPVPRPRFPRRNDYNDFGFGHCGAGGGKLMEPEPDEKAGAEIMRFPRLQSSGGVLPLRPLSFGIAVIQTYSRRPPGRPNPRRACTRRCILGLI